MKILVVMSDDQHGLAAGLQFRQQLCIKNFLEQRVSGRRPIRRTDKTIGPQDKAVNNASRLRWPGTAPGSRGRRLLFHLVVEVQLLQIIVRLRVESRIAQADQAVKQEVVRDTAEKIWR